jgi:hypothetical protein
MMRRYALLVILGWFLTGVPCIQALLVSPQQEMDTMDIIEIREQKRMLTPEEYEARKAEVIQRRNEEVLQKLDAPPSNFAHYRKATQRKRQQLQRTSDTLNYTSPAVKYVVMGFTALACLLALAAWYTARREKTA